jgi:flagellar biosynthesis anti-sigma factor FlgM
MPRQDEKAMNDIPPIQSAGQMSSVLSQRSAQARTSVPGEPADDRLEISETGQILSSLQPDSVIRADRVAQIRQAIADGTYETPDKIDLTVDRLLDVLREMHVGA